MAARVPENHEARVLVVENNCTDDTSEAVARESESASGRLRCIHESIQGSSAARNAGIRAAGGELIGFVDDDETVPPEWIEVAIGAFERSPELQFIGGPYVPEWECPAPEWAPPAFGAVIGWVQGPANETPYGPGFPGVLMSGNAVFRREVFERVGMYEIALGRTGSGLMCCEDHELYRRIVTAGLSGAWVPKLFIYHQVPAARLTKRYYRRWCWDRNTAAGYLRVDNLPGVPEVLGVPRWMYRSALEGAWSALRGAFTGRRPADTFAGELRCWSLAGYFRGRNLWRPPVKEPNAV